jgi:hypothetical protein
MAAMKISGSGPSPPLDGESVAEDVKDPTGKAFAEAVDKASPSSRAETPGEVTPAGAAAAVGAVADIVSDLRTGKVTAQAAVEKVIERVLAQQVGPDAPIAVREQVGAALRRALEEDPLLADKLRALGS